MEGVEQLQGIWRLRTESGILSISNPEHTIKMNILVLDISQKKIRCIGFDINNSATVEEFTMIKSDK